MTSNDIEMICCGFDALIETNENGNTALLTAIQLEGRKTRELLEKLLGNKE